MDGGGFGSFVVVVVNVGTIAYMLGSIGNGKNSFEMTQILFEVVIYII